MNTIIFKELLENFCQNFDRTKIDENIPSVFVPHVMSGYEESPKKIFYIGRDTNGWGSLDGTFKEYFDKNKMGEYLPDTAEWLEELGFLDYNKNKAGGFWTLVVRLHLKLKGVNAAVSVSSGIPEYTKAYLNDIGWGNTNSIEVQESLKKRKYSLDDSKTVWDVIDKSKYWYTKQLSNKIDKLKYIIDCFAPDYIFIFNWGTDDKMYLEGIEIESMKEYKEVNNHLWVYHLKNSNTKIIWTVHPNSLKFQSMNVDELVEILINFVK